MYKALYLNVLIYGAPCLATLVSCNPSGTVETLSKPRTSCDNRSVSDVPSKVADAQSMSMQHDAYEKAAK